MWKELADLNLYQGHRNIIQAKSITIQIETKAKSTCYAGGRIGELYASLISLQVSLIYRFPWPSV